MAYGYTAIGYKAQAKPAAKKVRVGKLDEQRFVAAAQQRGRQGIDDWIKAMNAAENPVTPNRALLLKLYNNLLTDGDLWSEWETRRLLRLVGAGFDMCDVANKPIEESTSMLETKWFYEFIRHAMSSKLLGTALVQIKDLNAEGKIDSINLIDRRYLIPEKGLYTPTVGEEKSGILYREGAFAPWLFEFGEPTDLGLLSKAVPYLLFMRFALSAWSEYAEKFVMPVRIGMTNTKDERSLNRMDTMLLEMATSSYAVIDKDEEFKFIEASKDGSPVFDNLIKTCNAKLSKLLNGSVIGEASAGGSRSKEEVGQDLQDLVTVGDMMWFEGIMNQDVIPRLTAMGYPFTDQKFRFKRSQDLQKLWIIVAGICTHYDVPGEYITDTFGVPVLGPKEVPVPGTGPTPPQDPKNPKNPKGSSDGFFD